MSKIQVQTTIDTSAFLTGAAKLRLDELEQLVRELDAIITRKRSQNQKYRESQLLRLINQAMLESDQRNRYIALTDKLEEETLAEEEYAEYMSLVEKDEQLRNERVKYLLELAQLKGVALPELVKLLGLNPGQDE